MRPRTPCGCCYHRFARFYHLMAESVLVNGKMHFVFMFQQTKRMNCVKQNASKECTAFQLNRIAFGHSMADYVHDDVRNYFATKKCVAHAHATAYAFLYFHSIEFFSVNFLLLQTFSSPKNVIANHNDQLKKIEFN